MRWQGSVSVPKAAPNGWGEQILLLRFLSERGLLHQAQKDHLEIWPRLFFQWSTKSRFYFDPEHKVIEFRLTAKKVPSKKLLQPSLERFTTSVQWLLGDSYRVLVKVGKVIILDHPGRVTQALVKPILNETNGK